MSTDVAVRGRLHWALIPLAGLLAVLPLIVHGCSCGHDFDFHLLNWMEAATQFSHGNLHPHWAYTPAFNAGEPRFVFYPPISWYLGAALGLILTHLPGVGEVAAWNAAPILFTWIALTASGFAMHRLTRHFAAPNAALLAAIIYLANPYLMFTAYERTAYGELLAAVWMPLLMLGVLRTRVTVADIAVPLALLWLTNAPAAVMGSYTLAVLSAVRIVATYLRGRKFSASLRLARITATGTMLGLGLAAFYIVPAAYERRYVQIAMATIAGMRIDENFLFEHTGTSSDALLHDTVLRTASTIAVILLIGTAVALFILHLQRSSAAKGRGRDGGNSSEEAFPAVSLAILAAGIGFLLTPWSVTIWRHAPQAAFLQFPWRLLAVVGVVFALAASQLLRRSRISGGGAAAAGVGLTLLLGFLGYRAFRQRCFPEDTPAARLALFHFNAGTDATDEYTPIGADNDADIANDPPYWLADLPGAPAPGQKTPGGTPSHFDVVAPRAGELVLNLRDYPAWRIAINGTLVPDSMHRVHRTDGLVVLAVPAGRSVIDIRWTQLPDQTMGDFVSAVALGLLFFRWRTERLRRA